MLKDFRTLIGLSIIALIGTVPMLFSSEKMNINEIDIYIFYEYTRYPELIAYDISEIFSVTFFIYLIWRLVPSRSHKRYVFCFLISSILSIMGYFLFYSQYISLLLVPLLILMIIITYFKYDYEKRNNAR